MEKYTDKGHNIARKTRDYTIDFLDTILKIYGIEDNGHAQYVAALSLIDSLVATGYHQAEEDNRMDFAWQELTDISKNRIINACMADTKEFTLTIEFKEKSKVPKITKSLFEYERSSLTREIDSFDKHCE